MSENTAPTWELTSYFPAFDGPEYRATRDGLESGYRALADEGASIGALTPATAANWRDFLLRAEKFLRDHSHLSSYLSCLSAGDTTNEAYRREKARLSALSALHRKAFIPFEAALRHADNASFETLATDPELATARYFLDRAREEARFTMAPDMEGLAADLGVDGLSAWGRLYSAIAGRLEFELKHPDGRIERVPMAQKVSRLEDPDPAVRRAVLESSNAAWEHTQDAVAACLNGIAGTRLTLNKRRGIAHFLDVAMFQSAVSRKTIEAMWSVVAERREIPRRFLKSKAKALRLAQFGFQDLSAPMVLASTQTAESKLTWDGGTAKLLAAFDRDYPALGAFARDMLAKRRVEAQKRPGKQPGAFCTSSYKSGESRVYMTWGGTLGDLQTLAHELGHAWHGYLMRDLRPFARPYPMTLAETASTFAEDLLGTALLEEPGLDSATRLRLLDERLSNGATFLLNIHMRYIFEERFHEERAAGEVPISRLKELMLDAQRACYGDALAADQLDPMFWASKLHFYITGITFYNFPYTFGYLLSRGLGARFRAEGPAFLPKYEEFLRIAASDTAEGVAQRTLGIDLTRPDFWIEAVESLEGELKLFEEAV